MEYTYRTEPEMIRKMPLRRPLPVRWRGEVEPDADSRREDVAEEVHCKHGLKDASGRRGDH